ncbi:uncharacterized protein LOC122465236 isoform X1 [Chelonia mydas]|uniref:uncharacterized protein LOC122465236 isoform X1 n=1 Tax=Chelonia mydas TaxID=8469 RepID=UPI001CA7ED7C|nr:uncharacterized protein LOC122465236 isoform X1 [Chelonia mydas]
MATRRLLSGTSESSSKAEKRTRPNSSCSWMPSTPRDSLPGREHRTHWSRTAARRLWWRGLCTMTAALEPELETHLLRAAPHAGFILGTEKDITHLQDLHRVLPNLMDAMLGNLLVESPDTDRLHDILEPMNYWIMSRVSQERARAIRSSTALLRFTITLPELDKAAEFPRMSHHVAELALFISDPAKDMSRQARREFTGSTSCCCTRGAHSEDSAHCAATNGIGRTQALQPE